MRMKKWIKILICILLIIFMIIIIKDIFTNKTTIVSTGKNYSCYGTIIQICSGIDYE